MTQIALVTGTSSGIGLETAVALAQAGFTVVATMRNTAKSDALMSKAEAAGVSLHLRTLDVQSDASIAACMEEIFRAHGHIDVLVNNAGAGFLGSLEQTSAADLQRTMDVNFFGVWRVTQAVFPHMRAARSGRIITVSSTGGLIGQPFNDAYCAAKFAVEGFMESLAPVAKRLGVHLSIVEPGPVNTEFVSSVRATLPDLQSVDPEAYTPLLTAYLSGTEQVFASIGQTGEDVARVIVEAATAVAPHFRYPTSDTVRGLIGRKFVDPSGDSVVALSGARLP